MQSTVTPATDSATSSRLRTAESGQHHQEIDGELEIAGADAVLLLEVEGEDAHPAEAHPVAKEDEQADAEQAAAGDRRIDRVEMADLQPQRHELGEDRDEADGGEGLHREGPAEPQQGEREEGQVHQQEQRGKIDGRRVAEEQGDTDRAARQQRGLGVEGDAERDEERPEDEGHGVLVETMPDAHLGERLVLGEGVSSDIDVCFAMNDSVAAAHNTRTGGFGRAQHLGRPAISAGPQGSEGSTACNSTNQGAASGRQSGPVRAPPCRTGRAGRPRARRGGRCAGRAAPPIAARCRR